MTEHKPEPDGYCTTCRTVPCRDSAGKRAGTKQLDRIEAKLNRIMRALKIEVES